MTHLEMGPARVALGLGDALTPVADTRAAGAATAAYARKQDILPK